MTKVTPTNEKTTHLSQPNAHTHETVSNYFDEEEDDFSPNQSTTPRKRYFNCPLSLFLVITLSILIVLCAVMVYLSVFVGLYTSVDELSSKMVFTVEGQVRNYVDRYLGSLKMASNIAAGHFNGGLVGSDTYRDYLYQVYNNSAIFVGFFLYVNNKSERYAFIMVNENLLYTYQESGFPGFIRDLVNATTGQVIRHNFTVLTSPQNLMRTEFFTFAISETERLKEEGVFGSPFYNFGGANLGGVISLPYSTRLYDRSLFPSERKLIGVCRSIVPLHLLSVYLSKVKVFEKGYVVLTEENRTLAVTGSIKTTTDDGISNLELFNLTQNNAGQLMKDISKSYNGMNNIPPKIHISSMGVKYIVTVSSYKFDNLAWRLFIIAYDDDVSFTTNLSIGISIGVSIIVVAIGLVYSLILSRIITRTVKYLEVQLNFVKVFDLDKVTISSSIFKEMNGIIDDLDKTVLWLKQVKAFIPSTVFHQIQNDDSSSQGDKQQENHETNNHENHETNTNSSFHVQKTEHSKHKTSSSTLHKDTQPNGLFKMGLSKKTCSIVSVIFNKFELQTNHHDLAVTFSKVSTLIRNAANLYQAHFQINSVEEITVVFEQKPNKKPPADLSLEFALKVSTIINSANIQLKDHDSNTLEFFIGISTSDDSYVGNLGSHSFRFYAFVSHSRKVSINLAILASSLGVRILIDEETFNKTNHNYISKPVDRLCMETSSINSFEICNVYELVKEKSVAQDEWLYELNNMNMNKEVESLNSVFSIFKDVTQEKSQLDHYISLINNYLSKFPNDPAIVHLAGILQHYNERRQYYETEDSPSLKNYCKKVYYSVTSTK